MNVTPFIEGWNSSVYAQYTIQVKDRTRVQENLKEKGIVTACDDKLCKKCQTLDLAIWTGNPVAFCDKEGLR